MPKKTSEPAKPDVPEEKGVPIVVRRSIIKDETPAAPMKAAETAEESNPIEVKSKKSRIEPLPSTTKPAPAEATVAAVPETPPEPAVAAVEKPTPPASPAPPATATPEKSSEPDTKPAEGPGEFTLAGQDSVETPEDPSQNPIDQAKAKADKEAAEKQAALDKLVDAQTYFLPLNSVEKRRTKQLLFVTLLLLVVLVGAGAFWANGQGIISIPGL